MDANVGVCRSFLHPFLHRYLWWKVIPTGRSRSDWLMDFWANRIAYFWLPTSVPTFVSYIQWILSYGGGKRACNLTQRRFRVPPIQDRTLKSDVELLLEAAGESGCEPFGCRYHGASANSAQSGELGSGYQHAECAWEHSASPCCWKRACGRSARVGWAGSRPPCSRSRRGYAASPRCVFWARGLDAGGRHLILELDNFRANLELQFYRLTFIF